MPYLTLAAPSRAALLAAANSRWDSLLEAHPELRPAVDLQRGLIGVVLDTTAALESGRMPKLSLPPRYLALKLARGTPIIAGEPIPLPAPLLTSAILRIADELANGGAGEAATHIADAIRGGRLDGTSLLTTSLGRDQPALQSGAVHLGLAPDLLWLVAELAVSPVAHILQRTLLGSPASELEQALASWNQGYCPACGSWPALAEVASQHRMLRCSFCAAAWELTAYACIHCGEAGEAFVTAAPDAERKDRRLELCGACGAYLKAVDVAALSPFPLVALADMETMDLDVAAVEHHYGRPPLRSFAVGHSSKGKGQT